MPPAADVTRQKDASILVEREKMRAAYGNWTQYVDGFPFAVGLVVIMSGRWPEIGDTPAVWSAGWLAAALVWAIGSSLAFRSYAISSPAMNVRASRALLCTVWAIHASIWGSAVLVFWQDGNAVNHAILNTITLAVIVSYFSCLTTCIPALFSALGALTLIQMSAFLYFGDASSHVFMVAFPAFLALMTNYGLAVGRKYDLALRLRFENEAMTSALTQATRAKSDFLASMSHELRTPLNAILGYSDLMRQRTLGPIMPARYAVYVDDIHASGQHLLKMINDLLDLSKIEAGQRELEFGPVHLSELAKDALRFVEPQAQQAHVSLMFDPKFDVVVKADERAVKQMLINLLSNAVKFSNPGSIAVIFFDVVSDNRVMLGVKDTGLGMTPEMQRRAIEPFVQYSDALTVEGHGTGLGLPIVKGLIEAHQGWLKIESTAGKGSKIWVEFPPERLIRQRQFAAA